MTYRIGIVAISHHKYLLNRFCEFAAPETNDVTIFTTDDGERELQDSSFYPNDLITFTHKDKITVLNTATDVSNSLDVLIVLTARGDAEILSKFSRFSPACPALLWMHHINEYTYSTSVPLARHVPPVLRKLLPQSMYAEALNHLAARMKPDILDRFDGILVSYPIMKQYVENETSIAKPVYCFYPVWYDGRSDSSSAGIDIIVPGGVSAQVRDYDTVLDTVQELGPNSGVTITLLGQKADDSNIPSRCRKMCEEGYPISCQIEETWIPEERYETALREADLLWAPLRKYYAEYGLPEREVYGRTKASGVILDAIKYGLPLVLPATFPVADEFERSTITYGTPCGLTNILTNLTRDPEQLRGFQQAAHTLATQYNLHKQKNRFQEIIRQICNK